MNAINVKGKKKKTPKTNVPYKYIAGPLSKLLAAKIQVPFCYCFPLPVRQYMP